MDSHNNSSADRAAPHNGWSAILLDVCALLDDIEVRWTRWLLLGRENWLLSFDPDGAGNHLGALMDLTLANTRRQTCGHSTNGRRSTSTS
jgi:hypothetical protein